MTDIYTYQIPKWRGLLKFGIPLIDTTVKTGDPRLSPTWSMVLGVKRGTWTEAQYTCAYHQLLDYWWFADPLFFDTLLTHPRFALGCYCTPHHFCHRYLLAEFLAQHTHATYCGELTSMSVVTPS